jgi:hypothetical protein
MKIFSKTLFIAFALTGIARADFGSGFVYYSTTFTNNSSSIPANQSFVSDLPLPGINDANFQDNWYSSLDSSYQTNPNTGGVSQNWLAPAGISSAVNGNYLFVGGAHVNNDPYKGFYAPTNQITDAKRGIADMGGGKLLGNGVSFSSIFYIDPGTNGFHDNFAWTLFNQNGNPLVSFDFNVVTNGGQISYDIGATSWANDNTNLVSQALIANGPAATNQGGVLNIQTNTTYGFKFEVNNIGIAGQQSVSLWSYNAGTNAPPTALATNQLLNYTDFSSSAYNNGDTNVAIIGLTWIINDTTLGGASNNQYVNFGNNAIYVSAFSVPEPSTWVLMGISGLIMVVALRRRKA